VLGIKTNLGFFRQLLDDDTFRCGELHTGLVDEFLARRPEIASGPELQAVAVLVAQAFLSAPKTGNERRTGEIASTAWRKAGRDELLQ